MRPRWKSEMGQMVKPGPTGIEAPGRACGAGEARLGFLGEEQRASIPVYRLEALGAEGAADSTGLIQNAQDPDCTLCPGSQVSPDLVLILLSRHLGPPGSWVGEHPLHRLRVCLVDRGGAGAGVRWGSAEASKSQIYPTYGIVFIPPGGAPAFSHFLPCTRWLLSQLEWGWGEE